MSKNIIATGHQFVRKPPSQKYMYATPTPGVGSNISFPRFPVLCLCRIRFSDELRLCKPSILNKIFATSSKLLLFIVSLHFKSMDSTEPPFPSSHLDSDSDTDSGDEHGPRLTATQEEQLKVESQVAEIYRCLVGVPLHRQSVV
jgi:hypothetical protein